jgi:low affinity Fe/Cu permease
MSSHSSGDPHPSTLDDQTLIRVSRGNQELAWSLVDCTIMLHPTRRALTRVGELTTHPAAFAVVVVYAIAWLIFSSETFGWGAIATLATWLMTLFITRTEHRDTQAIHAKIDELLRTHGEARTDLTRLDERDVEDIEEHRRRHRTDDAASLRGKPPRRPY